MEQLLHYVWKHKLFPLTTLVTTKGQEVEVIDPGLLNRNAGPDFFNAKVRIAGTMWVGNVEIHLKTSDWLAHHHNTDPAYDNVDRRQTAATAGAAHTAKRERQL